MNLGFVIFTISFKEIFDFQALMKSADYPVCVFLCVCVCVCVCLCVCVCARELLSRRHLIRQEI